MYQVEAPQFLVALRSSTHVDHAAEDCNQFVNSMAPRRRDNHPGFVISQVGVGSGRGRNDTLAWVSFRALPIPLQ